jgi:hypothetical protein
VSCTLEQFTRDVGKRKCEKCSGTGHVSDEEAENYNEQIGKHPMVAPAKQCTAGCVNGYFPAPFAATLFREWPITGVVLSDREPANTRPGRWTWFGPHPTERHETDEARLPGFLWVLLKHADYDTREAALSALSAVCVAWARQQAGLPPLGKRG